MLMCAAADRLRDKSDRGTWYRSLFASFELLGRTSSLCFRPTACVHTLVMVPLRWIFFSDGWSVDLAMVVALSFICLFPLTYLALHNFSSGSLFLVCNSIKTGFVLGAIRWFGLP